MIDPVTAETMKTGFENMVFRFGEMRGIASQVSEATGVSVEDMRSPSRLRHHARARQYCFYFGRAKGLSYAQIGRYFNRDHTTVMYGVRKISQIMEG